MAEKQGALYLPDTALIYPEAPIIYPQPVRDLLQAFNISHFRDPNMLPRYPRYYLIADKLLDPPRNGSSDTEEELWLITENIGNIRLPFSEVPPDLLGNIPGYVFKMIFKGITTSKGDRRARADFSLTRTQRAIREIRDTGFENPYFADHVVDG